MSSPSNEFNRRSFLQLSTSILAAATVPLLPAAGLGECEMTPDVVSGPFYPTRDRADEDVDLTRIEGRSDQAQGTVIRVRGRVLDASCEPVEGAVVELWQADSNGRYRHERDKQSAPIDPAFQGWGEATTGPKGQYGFKTIKPAPYRPGLVATSFGPRTSTSGCPTLTTTSGSHRCFSRVNRSTRPTTSCRGFRRESGSS